MEREDGLGFMRVGIFERERRENGLDVAMRSRGYQPHLWEIK